MDFFEAFKRTADIADIEPRGSARGKIPPCGGNVRVADKRGEDQGPPRVSINAVRKRLNKKAFSGNGILQKAKCPAYELTDQTFHRTIDPSMNRKQPVFPPGEYRLLSITGFIASLD